MRISGEVSTSGAVKRHRGQIIYGARIQVKPSKKTNIAGLFYATPRFPRVRLHTTIRRDIDAFCRGAWLRLKSIASQFGAVWEDVRGKLGAGNNCDATTN